jgi:ubiquinol-cytochrome c reductase cytochrome c1 subunit
MRAAMGATMMNKLVAGFLALAIFGGVTTAVFAEDKKPVAENATPVYPLKEPREQKWTFAGPFGYYDKAQLQRGLKVYAEVCSACHSMNLVPFRTISDLGYSDAQIKTFAANYETQDGPNAQGEMYTRKARRHRISR